MEEPRRRVSSAHVIAVVALVVALGGVAYAGTMVPDNSVGTKSVVNESLRTQDVRNGTIRGPDVAEITLGLVPDAARVQGQLPQVFQRRGVRVEVKDVAGGDPVDLTPDVTGLSALVLDYNIPTVLGGGGNQVFTGGVKGQVLTVVSRNDQIVFAEGGNNVELGAGGSWTGESNDTITLVFAGGKWYEIARSVN